MTFERVLVGATLLFVVYTVGRWHARDDLAECNHRLCPRGMPALVGATLECVCVLPPTTGTPAEPL